MKKLKNSITTLLFITLLMGCNEHKERQYVVEGRLMYSCGVPAANVQDIAIKQVPPAMNLGKDPIFKRFSTDEDGYFKIIYKYKEASSSPMYFAKSGKFFEGIPSYENLDLGEVFYGTPTFSYVRRLKVNNPYTENDTLQLPDYNNDSEPYAFKLISGPFIDGIIDTVWNQPYMGMGTIEYKKTPEYKPYYKLTSEHDWRETTIKLDDLCFEGLYNVVLIVD